MTDRRFRPYFRPGRGVTTWLNLMEVYYALLRDGMPKETARAVVEAARPDLVEFSFEEILEGVELRFRWHGRDKTISYVDAIGFTLAQKRRLNFLTGDPAFRGVRGVTFLRSRGAGR